MPTATETPAKKRVRKQAAPVPVAPPARDTRGQIQVRMAQDLVDRLGVEADRRMVSKAWLVEQIIANALPKWEDQDMTPA